MGLMAHQQFKSVALKSQHHHRVYKRAVAGNRMLTCRNVNAAKQHANANTKMKELERPEERAAQIAAYLAADDSDATVERSDEESDEEESDDDGAMGE